MTTIQASAPDFGHLPQNGRWVWRDESKTLEYISNNPGLDRKDAKKRNAKPGFLPQDFVSKRNDRATPNLGNRSYDEQVKNRQHGLQRLVKLRQKQTEESTITLDRAKDVAYDVMADTEVICPPFDDLFDTTQFDIFLIQLLKYFQTFFEKKAHENKPNPMNIEPSLADVKLAEDLEKQLNSDKKQLGQAYCVLVLGLGLEDYHHMACGLSRVSATYTDRSMYETIYSFCTFLVWIVFRRKDYEHIKEEVGNMLRSDTFNPALRVKNHVEEEPKKRVSLKQTNDENIQNIRGKLVNKKVNHVATFDKVNPAEYRRLHPKRPAIKTIIHQRSPAVVAILPSPKEEASWLFHRKGALSPTSLAQINREKLEVDEHDAKLDLVTAMDKSALRAGILGESLSQFHALTLTPLGTENEDDDDESSQAGDRRGSTAVGKTVGEPSRQQTARSTVTTEAPFPDDDDDDIQND